MSRLAVVLFSLGAPERIEAVRPFLRNLFSDRAILQVPQPLRWVLARILSARRAGPAGDIYRRIGGGSPLLANTRAQARALEGVLTQRGMTARCFVSMRYWHPLAAETAAAVRDWGADAVVLLPLYPQFSTTTTASSLRSWRMAAESVGLAAPAHTICCYPIEQGFVKAMATLLRAALRQGHGFGRARVLFSAHGLPQRVVKRGDPYTWQVERTAEAVAAALRDEIADWRVCFQSRVGPLKWTQPYIEDELARAAKDAVPVVVVPIAFVAEHSETLVELDMEYRDRAKEMGVPGYLRVGTVGTDPAFIGGLADLVAAAVTGERSISSGGNGRLCPAGAAGCAFAGEA